MPETPVAYLRNKNGDNIIKLKHKLCQSIIAVIKKKEEKSKKLQLRAFKENG